MGDFSNSHAELKRRVERRTELLDQIAEAQEALKVMKAEDKNDGFNEKVIGQMLRELRRGPEYQADQLSLELEIDTYRQALGLPTTLEAAQIAVREEAEALPEPERREVRLAAADLHRLADEDGTEVSIEDSAGNVTTFGKGKGRRK